MRYERPDREPNLQPAVPSEFFRGAVIAFALSTLMWVGIGLIIWALTR